MIRMSDLTAGSGASRAVLAACAAILLAACSVAAPRSAPSSGDRPIAQYTGASGYERIEVEVLPPCGGAFEQVGRSRIKQKSPLPEGQRCTVRVTVSSGGTLLDDVPVYLAVRGCAWTDPFKRIGRALTRAGVAELAFEYYNDRRFCSFLLTAGRERGSKSQRMRIDAFVEAGRRQ